jgi:predicted DNA-binding transcriptional regulator AlpA
MFSSNRPASRRREGLTDDEAPNRLGNPLLGAPAVQEYCGGISNMTHWRWEQDLGFPPPDIVIARRRFWRLSTVENWLEEQRADYQSRRQAAKESIPPPDLRLRRGPRRTRSDTAAAAPSALAAAPPND